MSGKEVKGQKILETLAQKMFYLDYADSYGVIILKNGLPINVRNFYEYFRESWNDYNKAVKSKDLRHLKTFYEETGGGILSNGEMDIDVEQIAAAISVYKMAKNKEDEETPLDDDPEALKFKMGDSN